MFITTPKTMAINIPLAFKNAEKLFYRGNSFGRQRQKRRLRHNH